MGRAGRASCLPRLSPPRRPGWLAGWGWGTAIGQADLTPSLASAPLCVC